MNSFVKIFEIPVTNLSRAIDFYEKIFNIKIEAMDMGDMKIGLFPSEDQACFGILAEGEDYSPAPGGVTIYLDGGNDLQDVLSLVEEHGGKIVVPKSLHADESGYFGLFIDSEGNKMGLHSLN